MAEQDNNDVMDELPPLTRAEVGAKIDAIYARVARGELRHREELEMWGGALAERMAALEKRQTGVEKRLANVEQRFTLFERRITANMSALEKRLLAELARHATAIQESVASQLRVFDDKHKLLVTKPRRGRPS